MPRALLSTLMLASLYLLTCAPIAIQQHLEFTPSTVSLIHQGMTPSEIEEIFGKPDETYKMTFGENTPKTWEGLVYKYYVALDPQYQYVDRYRTNTFVFYTGTNPPQLNHWNLEHVYDED